jgi:hypothetical protein
MSRKSGELVSPVAQFGDARPSACLEAGGRIDMNSLDPGFHRGDDFLP